MFKKNKNKAEKITEAEKISIPENITDPKALWEPAKPGETLKDVWIPNRKERRKMMHAKKGANKQAVKAMGKLLQQTEDYARNNPSFKQDLYKALYENLVKKTANIEEELKKKNEIELKMKENTDNGTTEGN